MPQLNKLNQKDSINNTSIIQSGTTYEIKNLKAITSEKYFAAPVWSPDGKMIALTDLNFKGISVENVADGTPKKITDDEGAGFRFSWSPDSKEIVYLSRKVIDGEPANAIKLIEIETGEIIELTACGIGASMPSFSKSSEIIYSYKGTSMRKKGSIDQNTNKKSYEPEVLTKSSLKVFPNPSKGIFKIEGLQANGRNRISVYSIQGKLIREKSAILPSI
ncbi:MAG: hypothetical protein Q8N05_20320 [Bacteroidota bacterium]|nr:hypothetical protein [Bacteroidota bacterium]